MKTEWKSNVYLARSRIQVRSRWAREAGAGPGSGGPGSGRPGCWRRAVRGLPAAEAGHHVWGIRPWMLLLPPWGDWTLHLRVSTRARGPPGARCSALTGFGERSRELFQILVRNTSETTFKRCSSVWGSPLEAVFSRERCVFWCLECGGPSRSSVGSAFKLPPQSVRAEPRMSLVRISPGCARMEARAHFAKCLSP